MIQLNLFFYKYIAPEPEAKADLQAAGRNLE